MYRMDFLLTVTDGRTVKSCLEELNTVVYDWRKSHQGEPNAGGKFKPVLLSVFLKDKDELKDFFLSYLKGEKLNEWLQMSCGFVYTGRGKKRELTLHDETKDKKGVVTRAASHINTVNFCKQGDLLNPWGDCLGNSKKKLPVASTAQVTSTPQGAPMRVTEKQQGMNTSQLHDWLY